MGISLCYESIQKTLNRLSPERRCDADLLRVGFCSQRLCGCLTGSPCYWSSAPCPNRTDMEHVTYTLSSKVSFIVGLSVTPYQAYMHPNAPIYGPQEVCIQFLKSAQSPTNRYKVMRLTTEQLAEDVYYQSAFFEVRNVYEAQAFYLPSPVLCVSGTVRVVYRGMHQRQLLGPGTIEEYYLCISQCAILAVPVPDCLGVLDVEDKVDAHGCDKIVNITCSGKRVRSGLFTYSPAAGGDNGSCEEFLRKHLPRKVLTEKGNIRKEAGQGSQEETSEQCVVS